MSELEKLEAGLEYYFTDREINVLKLRAMERYQKLNAIDVRDYNKRYLAIKELFGQVGENAVVLPFFSCDNGRNIYVGDNFLANYNVTILDVRQVSIGNNVMIGPKTLISTANHPLNPMGRRRHLGIAKPVRIDNDVWIGGNCMIFARCKDWKQCCYCGRRCYKRR